MTLATFAVSVDITSSYASYLRSGDRLPSGDLLVRIILVHELDPITTLTAYEKGKAAFGAYLRETIFKKNDVAEPEESSVVPSN